MSDECLMKQELGFPFYVVYQAVMRKFTLARKSLQLEKCDNNLASLLAASGLTVANL